MYAHTLCVGIRHTPRTIYTAYVVHHVRVRQLAVDLQIQKTHGHGRQLLQQIEADKLDQCREWDQPY